MRPIERRLRRRVGGLREAGGGEAEDARDVDDRAARLHHAPARLRHPVAAVEVDVDDLAELVGLLARRRVGGPDAGVVDEDVDAPELLDGGVDERLAVLGLGDVGGDRDRPPARRLDELLGLLQLLDAPRAERDVGAGLSQRLGERHPEARRGSGDDRDLAVQLEPVQDSHARGPYPPGAAARHATMPRHGCGTWIRRAGSVVARHRRAARARARLVAAGGRQRARLRRGRADQRGQLRPRRGGRRPRRPRHDRARARGRRARLLRRRPSDRAPLLRRRRRRSRSAPSSTASPSSSCSASASPPATG